MTNSLKPFTPASSAKQSGVDPRVNRLFVKKEPYKHRSSNQTIQEGEPRILKNDDELMNFIRSNRQGSQNYNYLPQANFDKNKNGQNLGESIIMSQVKAAKTSQKIKK